MRRHVSTCLLLGVAVAGGAVAARGQALVTASRAGDIQVGGGFSIASPDYQPGSIKGGAFYGDFDFMKHVGLEVGFHQMNATENSLYERTYEVGGRYLLKPHGALKPYIKGLYGRGVLNFPQNEANIAYNMFVAGGGVDYGVKRWLTMRADFEYQYWLSGPGIQDGLTPLVGTVGVAYRFGSDKLNGRQWLLPASRPQTAPRNQQPVAGPPAPSSN